MSESKKEVEGADFRFNWSDIDVGNDLLDHSQNFFAQRHIKHERLDDEVMQGVVEMFCETGLGLGETNAVAYVANENKENAASSLSQQTSPQKSPLPLSVPGDTCPISFNGVTGAGAADASVTATATATVIDPTKPRRNMVTQWSAVKRPLVRSCASAMALAAAATGRGAIPECAPPHVYQFKDIYQRKKEELLRNRMAEERKLREFRSRPMPNFQQQNEQRQIVHYVTVPTTPLVLKRSREADDKRKQKLQLQLQEIEESKRMQKPTKEHRPLGLDAVMEEPFVPKKNRVLRPHPFTLSLERRLQERKQFDAGVQKAIGDRLKQQEEARKKREEQEIRELRKLTTFKARPNPFK